MTVATKTCVPQQALAALREFAQEKMCWRCLPCPLGVAEALMILERITWGRGEKEDLERLSRIAKELRWTARCRRGREAAENLARFLREEREFQEHLEGTCLAGFCVRLRRFTIVPELCTMCDRCREVCSRAAIVGDPYVAYLGDNRPYTIRRAKCDGCGLCVPVCPVGAIVPA